MFSPLVSELHISLIRRQMADVAYLAAVKVGRHNLWGYMVH